VLRDVTSEAMAERTKENFLNQITHELRTPLTAIKGYADVLRMGSDRLKPDMKERAVETIYLASHTLAQMIDTIVDLTAIQSGSMVLEHAPVQLKAVISETLEAWEQLFHDNKVKPQFNKKAPNLSVMGDARRIRRALDALFQNACDFSPEGGKLAISLQSQELFAVITVADQGVGISPEELQHVFERFFRGKPRDKEGNLLDVRGMGQGLFVVKAVVEAHGGSVQVESSPSKGTTVRLYLPLVPSGRV